MIEQAKEWFRTQPLGFVDIGARGGVHPLVEPIAEVVSVLGFEPDKEAAMEAGIVCVPLALSDRCETGTLWRCAASTNDSLRPINQQFVDRYNMVKFAQTGRSEVQLNALDNVIGLFRRQAEFIKLDTQGSEYEILRGADRTLATTSAIYCEVEFAQIYQDQRLFGDIEVFLRREHGFSFIGFDNMSYRSRTPGVGRERLLHADALFIKDPLEITISKRQAQVACMACLLCGYDDLAKEIMETL